MTRPPDRHVTFRMLGELEMVGEEGKAMAPVGRQLTILAALLLDVNQVVTLHRLVDAVWGTCPPSTACAQIYICISSLRQDFRALNVKAEIVTQRPGYRLEVRQESVDKYLFEHEMAMARALAAEGDLATASAVTRAAMRMWRGPVFGGVMHQMDNRVVLIEALRYEAKLFQIDLEMRAGNHHDVLGELNALVTEYPFVESLRVQLMLALYRCGRTADALEVYRAGRRLMVEELGIEPGEELRRLEAAILASDRDLLAPDSVKQQITPAHRPRQLPPDIADFIGRHDEIAAVQLILANTGLQGTAVPVVNVFGPEGIGKTAFVVHVAHLIRSSYPDGQLYVDLSAPGERRLSTSDLLGRFLKALGLSSEEIPESQVERMETYRTVLSRRQVLVVLDGVEKTDRISCLLPGESGCAVLVASRFAQEEVPGARYVVLEPFDSGDAHAMLETIIGRARLAADPVGVQMLLKAAGGVPRSLRAIGIRIIVECQIGYDSDE